ncbi:hypothetical protein [Agromyces sp. NPDC058110]|uniref:hypothetical protein n=1 Tax=Agromyces sp. NPDC058110 TaxID=3346345 RepID=UPI0036DD34D5
MSALERRGEADAGGDPRRGAGAGEGRGFVARFFGRPSVRRTIARVVVVIGVVFALVGVLTARYGFLVVGVIVIGLGAAFGPARIRR